MDWLYLFLSFTAGGVMGAVFFGGLWWTVQKITDSEKPYLIIIASFVVRTGVVLTGFYFIMGYGWANLMLGTAGFLICRVFIAYKLGPATKRETGNIGNAESDIDDSISQRGQNSNENAGEEDANK